MVRLGLLARDEAVRERLRACAAECGFEVVDSVVNGVSASAPGASVEVLVVDSRTLLGAAAATEPNAPPLVVVAAAPSIAEAVDCMRAGAEDYIVLSPSAGAKALDEAVSGALARRGAPTAAFPGLVGACPAMRDLGARIASAARADIAVLIQGEAGTGKELVARSLHAASARAHAPFITLSCAAVPAALIETELFGDGWRRGLIQAAAQGTLFLDDVDELPLAAQHRLERLVGRNEPGGQDVRVVAASRHSLAALAGAGRFLATLFDRLSSVALAVPPLRVRGEDVLLIARVALARAARRLDKCAASFAPAAQALLRRYPWPGNVRELVHVVERAAILCDGAVVGPELLAIEAAGDASEHAAASREPFADGSEDGEDGTPSGALENFFRCFVLAHQEDLTETELADKLGISRKSLWERRQRLNIPRRRTHQRGPRRDRG